MVVGWADIPELSTCVGRRQWLGYSRGRRALILDHPLMSAEHIPKLRLGHANFAMEDLPPKLV